MAMRASCTITQEDAIVGDKKKLAALSRVSGVERELFGTGTAMAQLLRGCRAALQRKLEVLAAQRTRHEVPDNQGLCSGAITFKSAPERRLAQMMHDMSFDSMHAFRMRRQQSRGSLMDGPKSCRAWPASLCRTVQMPMSRS